MVISEGLSLEGRARTAQNQVSGLQELEGDVEGQNDCAAHAWQCSICLEGIEHADLAVIRQCQHTYCGAYLIAGTSCTGNAWTQCCSLARCLESPYVCTTHMLTRELVHAAPCILQWASRSSDDPRCPACKHSFSKLLVHKALDGELCDEPLEETVVLLARAPWFRSWQAERNQLNELTRQAPFRSVEAAESERSPLAVAQEEWAEEAMYGYFEEEYESYYGELEEYMEQPRSRIAIGNRRCSVKQRLSQKFSQTAAVVGSSRLCPACSDRQHASPWPRFPSCKLSVPAPSYLDATWTVPYSRHPHCANAGGAPMAMCAPDASWPRPYKASPVATKGRLPPRASLLHSKARRVGRVGTQAVVLAARPRGANQAMRLAPLGRDWRFECG
jgi:hypothetical protein